MKKKWLLAAALVSMLVLFTGILLTQYNCDVTLEKSGVKWTVTRYPLMYEGAFVVMLGFVSFLVTIFSTLTYYHTHKHEKLIQGA